MNKHRLQAELWETQTWLMWILAAILFHTEHPILGGAVMVWSGVTVLGMLIKLSKARKEDLDFDSLT